MKAIGVTKAYDTLRNDIVRLAKEADQMVEDLTRFGPDLNSMLVVGDNLDKTFKATVVRKGRKNKQFHAFQQFVTLPRKFEQSLPTIPEVEETDVQPEQYLHNQGDVDRIKEYARAIVLDAAVDHLPGFGKIFTRGLLEVPVDPVMANETMIVILPLLFKNENKNAELIEILESDLVRSSLDPLQKGTKH